MIIGPLPDAFWTPDGRSGTGVSRRQNALDPGFMTFQLARRIGTAMLAVPV
jgi:hypothetical protein